MKNYQAEEVGGGGGGEERYYGGADFLGHRRIMKVLFAVKFYFHANASGACNAQSKNKIIDR